MVEKEVVQKQEAKKRRKKEESTPIDLIMWIGRRDYTITSFVREARRFGCCKRIPPHLPNQLEVGKSRIYLAHDTADEDEKEEQQEEERKPKEWHKWDRQRRPYRRGKPRVFGYYIARRIEAVEDEDFPPRELDEGVRVLSTEAAKERPERLCGKQKPGGLYIVSERDMDKFRKERKRKTLRETIELIKPVQTRLRRFRGFKYVLGDMIGKAPERDWFP